MFFLANLEITRDMSKEDLPQQMVDPVTLQKAANVIKDVGYIIFFTGAGISAESGINTFRDPEHGVWANKIGLVMFGTPFGWNWIPGISWYFYRGFLEPIVSAQPNAAHLAITQMYKRQDKKVKVITQNVDNLHQKAGIPDKDCAELHGTVFKYRCITNGHPLDVNIENGIPESSPICPICKSNGRPNATLFTESLPSEAFDNAEKWTQECLDEHGVMVIIGTTGVVYPAASIAENFIENGGIVIEINPEPSTYTPHVNYFLKGNAGQVMPELFRLAFGEVTDDENIETHIHEKTEEKSDVKETEKEFDDKVERVEEKKEKLKEEKDKKEENK
ncbi:NAD-dependent deacetylase, putative [Entamoeba invadens IP1]|uniref:NAD-dependent deacetylase, putative n=1 Tax=Entamoeba invadens IP1 TaxID=370355 RepID=UPI0002C3D1D1|nr:NAD-dependent deacetylase, putative [Entamoeba invadens IP1]ELP94027.1 NAD-dependent deacetylase, putative [Entamoeba invadens IP1]|eukprot:XP_004260798.1 NAD-dependent deacetylase, putative [Entamoeba invadens IP1]